MSYAHGNIRQLFGGTAMSEKREPMRFAEWLLVMDSEDGEFKQWTSERKFEAYKEYRTRWDEANED